MTRSTREPYAPAPDGFRNWLTGLSLLTPREMFLRLEEEGYVGQEAARVAVCLMAYRHIRRIRMIHLDGVPRDALPAKDNLLLLGPTGCGKTYLVELLFQRILQLPTIIADMTSFSESGYVGSSVGSIMPRLVHAANGNKEKASVGIVCLDEFDKLAGATSSVRFAGQGTTKDVSGFGVQRELLKLLESTAIDTTDDANYQPRQIFGTHDIPFIASGAFSGLKSAILNRCQASRIGFGAAPGAPAPHAIAQSVSTEEVLPVANFTAYGMMPELMGRFSRIVPLQPMGATELRCILTDHLIARYRSELARAHVRLSIQDQVIDHIVESCIEMETGARSIGAMLSAHLEQACFDVYSAPSPAGSTVHLEVRGDTVQCRIRDSKGSAIATSLAIS